MTYPKHQSFHYVPTKNAFLGRQLDWMDIDMVVSASRLRELYFFFSFLGGKVNKFLPTLMVLQWTTNRKWPQLGILSPIGDLKSPTGYFLSNWELGVFFWLSCPVLDIPNLVYYPLLGIRYSQLGKFCVSSLMNISIFFPNSTLVFQHYWKKGIW